DRAREKDQRRVAVTLPVVAEHLVVASVLLDHVHDVLERWIRERAAIRRPAIRRGHARREARERRSRRRRQRNAHERTVQGCHDVRAIARLIDERRLRLWPRWVGT